MKLSFPLYLKILGWFFLNVLLLGVVGWLLLAFQFHLGPEILLSGRSGDRVRAVSQTLGEELQARPRREWNEILERFSAGYGLEFRVYGGDQGLIAGPQVALPPEVREKLAVRRPPAGRDGPRQRERGPGSPPNAEELPSFNRRDSQGDDFIRRRPSGEEIERRRAMISQPSANPPLFMVKTKAPIAGYWIGTRMTSPLREGRALEPMTLVIFSENLSVGGLLVDFSVWIWVALGAFLFSVLFWAPLIYNITRSVRQMTEATSHIAEGRFEVRVNQNRRDELGVLAGAINLMAERLAGFVSGQKRFTGDVAHELCSPLARMQMALGIMEQQPLSATQQTYLHDLREDVEHMSTLVNELLAFSKAALGSKTLRMLPVRVTEMVARAVKRESNEGVEVVLKVDEDLHVMADPDLLFRAVSNVIRNAVNYAGHAGPISVSARKEAAYTDIIIQDSGSGVPEGDLPRLFDPFYRVDLARARETGGTGLGLAIVKTCVESCGGSVTCRNLRQKGFEVILRLPSA